MFTYDFRELQITCMLLCQKRPYSTEKTANSIDTKMELYAVTKLINRTMFEKNPNSIASLCNLSVTRDSANLGSLSSDSLIRTVLYQVLCLGPPRQLC